MRLKIKLTFIVLCVFFLNITVNAQIEKERVFNRVSIPLELNGGSLATHKLLSLSSDDFLWYTTANGLVKEYGGTHTFFPLGNGLGKGIEQFYAILEDKKGNVWLGTSNGLYVVDNTGESKRIEWQYPESNEIAVIIDLIELDNGHIVMSTNGQYKLKYDSDKDELLSYRIPDKFFPKSNPSSLADTDRINILAALPDNMLVSSQFNSLFLYRDGGIELLKAYGNLPRVISNEFGFEIIDNDGTILPKDSSASYKYKGKTYKYDYFPSIDKQVIQLPSKDFKGLYNVARPLGNSIEFIARRGASSTQLGFYRLDLETRTLEETPTVLTYKTAIIDYVFDKNSGVIYTSTINSLEAARPIKNKFTKYVINDKQTINNTSIGTSSFAQNPEGDVFMCTYAGLFKLDTKGEQPIILDKKNNENIEGLVYKSMIFENDSILWSLGDSKNIHRINIENKRHTSYVVENDITRGDIRFYDIQEWNKEEYIIASTHGLWSFNKNTKKFKNLSILNSKNDLRNQEIRKLLVEKDGGVWMATTGAGIYYKNFISGEVRQHTKENTNGEIASNVIYTLFKASDGDFYFGSNEGIIFMNTEQESFRTYNVSDGIAHNTVIGIEENAEGIWMSTFNGLTCYNYQDNEFYNFFKDSGLLDNQFNQQAYFIDDNKRLYFAGFNGAISFAEGDLTFKKSDSRLSIVSLEYYDDELEKNIIKDTGIPKNVEEITLLPEKNFFTIVFALTNPFNTNKAVYEYKIEGLKDEWISLRNDNELRLYGLPSGSFNIIIRAKDVNGNSAINTINIPLLVGEVFYKKNWFLIVVVLLLVLGIVTFFQVRKLRWKATLAQQRKVDQMEAKALRAQMNPHFMFNALNGLQSTMILKGEREANKYLGSFSKILRASLDMSKSDVITLEEEINYLEAYLDLEKLRQARPLITEIKLIPEDMDIKKIKLPCMFFQPLLENAILHGLSPKREGEAALTITFIEDDKALTGIVQDNGIGREAAYKLKQKNRKTHKSWATTIMEERIEIINKYTDSNVYFHIDDLYEKEQPIGTRATLSIPLDID